MSATLAPMFEEQNDNISGVFNVPAIELPQNYTIIFTELEKLVNLTLDRKELEIALNGAANLDADDPLNSNNHLGLKPHFGTQNVLKSHRKEDQVISDVWVGVILTLLIVIVIFFICFCFLLHKYRKWKNCYRTSRRAEVPEMCRHYPHIDFEAESLPSYTIVSGLPSYDDALEQFRKAGIILNPPRVPVIKIFESEATKEAQVKNLENSLQDITANNSATTTAVVNNTTTPSTENVNDSNSLSSNCICGAVGTMIPATPPNSTISLCVPAHANTSSTRIIELTADQLAALSQKRLSLQIAFSADMGVPERASARRLSRPNRINLYREANRNNHFRARAQSTVSGLGGWPHSELHRSSSSNSVVTEPACSLQHLQHYLQHRGSLY